MNIAIVGGDGKMGQLISHFLKKNHHEVIIIGRRTQNIKKLLDKSDVIMFSIPLDAFAETIKKFRGINLKRKLLIDLSSYVGSNIKNLKSVSSDVVFMHLLFGPDIYHLQGQNIIVSNNNAGGTKFNEIINIFKKEGTNIIKSSAENHDKMMANTQALSQFNSILLAKTISELGASRTELDNFSTLTFSLNKEVISRIVRQDAQLWAGIQFYNKYFPDILKRHRNNFDLLATLVDKRDNKLFAKMFGAVASFWESEKKNAFVLKKNEAVAAHKKGRIGILGPQGSFSQQAAFQYQQTLKPVFFETILDAINAISKGEIDKAILPFENSIEGTVRETLDGLYRHNIKIIDEVIVSIRHCIAGIDRKIPARDIEYIYSHPQALAQCRAYIQKHYPLAKLVLTPSTSSAFQKIKNEGLINARAIGPRMAADIYKLSVIEENIQAKDNNKTLFVVVSKNPKESGKLNNTLLVVDPKEDKPGLLYKILGVFASKGINLSKIESRPSQNNFGEYIFYLKADIKNNDIVFKDIIKELNKFGSITIITN